MRVRWIATLLVPFDDPVSAPARVYLPRAHLVHVHAFTFGPREDASLHFFGAFSDVARPPHVTLGPISDDDARALAETLKIRLGLPLLRAVCTADELDDRFPQDAFVIATCEYRATSGAPNFGRVRLAGSLYHEAPQRGIRERTYRVTGFYHAPRRDPSRPLPGSYGGPTLEVLEMVAVGRP